MSLELEVPLLVISFGVFLLIAQLPAVPKPHWLLPASAPPEESPKKVRL
jgi:hypothetical protein